MSNNYFTITEQYRERFYQLPKVFFTNENYKKMSNDAKISYAILKDRLELSIQNNWVDNDGNIYFIYTIKQLEDILNCGNQKVNKIKKELENVGLLIQKRQGLNKPNLLYLLKPEIKESDIYKISEEEEKTVNPLQDKEMLKSHFRKCENHTSGNVKITHQDVLKSHASDTEFSDTELNDTEFNDTTTTKEQYSSGSSNISKWINKIQIEFQIKITKQYQEQLEHLLSNFNDEVIAEAIDYSSKRGTNPKAYLPKVLQNWKEANIQTVEEAQNYSVKPKEHTQTREKTPEWLEDRDENGNSNICEDEIDEDLEQDRKAFLEQLEKDWGNDGSLQ